jgi:acetylornithine deacetylase/succinyl-diaminopimelate desuccinylase-like protein
LAKYAPKGLPPHAPHILFYGHYDVQPADPLELWTSPPFEPQVRKGKDGRNRIFARGASDDKGQLMTFLEASRAWLSVHGSLPFKLTILLEGDEEGDSSHLDRFVAANREELRADVAVICDTGLWDDHTPAIITGLRGCIFEEVAITGPKRDLHSGKYGGPAVNPLRVLAGIIAGMHGKNGRITIPGFYEGVKPLSPALRRQWDNLNFPAGKYLADVGLAVPAGEKDFTVLEQMWARPTAEVNGIWGGYTGAGTKTVIPAAASAKLSFRLVAGQKPGHIRKIFHQFVRARLPRDCRARFISEGGDSTGISVATNSKWTSAAKEALAAEWGRAPVLCGAGYSIPVVESFKNHL